MLENWAVALTALLETSFVGPLDCDARVLRIVFFRSFHDVYFTLSRPAIDSVAVWAKPHPLLSFALISMTRRRSIPRAPTRHERSHTMAGILNLFNPLINPIYTFLLSRA
ncbi:hypothetical protein C8R45DRAFT_306071 [Mycena sanguinolenta]|nr:hypothetical protein C8R45DRAFT_306071 [Mycena sanguinolenta]